MEKNKENKQAQKKPKEIDVGITVKKNDDFSEWFTQLMQKAELADVRYNVKGFPVYMPWSVRSMKKMYKIMENILERKNHEPLLMPVVIPESNFKLESSHVAGFTPEVFWITEHGDGEKFEERLALRPTSETALYQMYSLWIRSYKDLPFKRYQSVSVYRCEGKATRPFFRTREIHWIEAHNVFATEEDARRQVLEDMDSTKEFLLDTLAMPFIFFQRPEWDKFAGAVHTFAADALMPSGKVLQLPSTHLLGENFSKPFNVKYKDKDGEEKYGHITCFGPAISRIYGALIALHGDDKGLVLPFDVAPYQVVIVPILFEKTRDLVLNKCAEIKKVIEQKYSVLLDCDLDNNPGWKFNQWEMKGVPVRIEVGPKDIEKQQLVIFRRDLNEKKFIKESDLIKELDLISSTFTENMRSHALKMFENNIIDAKTETEIKKGIEQEKIVRANFCSIEKDGEHCAELIEKEFGAFVRGVKCGTNEKPTGNCAVCGKKANSVVYIARSY